MELFKTIRRRVKARSKVFKKNRFARVPNFRTLAVEYLEDRRVLAFVSDIADQFVLEDATTNPVGFRIGDADTPPEQLSVSAISSDPTIVPNNGITISGLGAERTITVAPLPNAHGEVNITVSVTDGSETADDVFQVTVISANDTPTLSNIATQSITEDGVLGPLAITVGDLETSAGDLTITATSSNPAVIPISGVSLGGTGSQRTVTITPAAGEIGKSVITLTVSDGFANVSSGFEVTVLPDNSLNHAPRVTNDVYFVNPGTTLVSNTGAVLANDVDPDNDSLSVELVTNVQKGQLTLQANGSFTYTPNAGYTGLDSFTYRASDGDTFSTSAMVRIDVRSDSAPTSVTDSYTLQEDGSLWIAPAQGVLANDTDSDTELLTATVVTQPSSGTLHFREDGGFTYEPNADFSGTDSFTYRVADDRSSSAIATVTLTVESVNDSPVAVTDTYNLDEGVTLNVSASNGVLDNDEDPECSVLIVSTIAKQPTHGVLTSNPDGSFSYVPAAGYVGPDHFLYIASDGSAVSSETLVNLDVRPIIKPPISASDSFVAGEDSPLIVPTTFGVVANDYDPVSPSLAAAVLVSDTSHGLLIFGPGGGFEYTPYANFNGTDSFTYRLTDGSRSSEPATVTIAVYAVPDFPVGQPESYVASEDQVLTVAALGGVLANDSDSDGDVLEATLLTPPSHGSIELAPDGSFVYIPELDYFGSDSFAYAASDGARQSEAITVSLNVGTTNDAPTAVPDEFHVREGESLVVQAANGLLSNDLDHESNPLSALLVSEPTHGTVVLQNDGSFVYTPVSSYVGPDSFTYRAVDSSQQSAVTTVSISVHPYDDEILFATDLQFVDGSANHQTEIGNELLGDLDVDLYRVSLLAGEQLSIDIDANDRGASGFVSGELNAAVRLFNSAGIEVAFNDDAVDPMSRWHGVDPALRYLASLTGDYFVGVSANQNVTYNPLVGGSGTAADRGRYHLRLTIDHRPEAGGNNYSVAEDSELSVAAPGLLSNDSDADGQSLVVTILTPPAHGAVTLNAGGAFVYVPTADFFGVDSFTYAASDGQLQSAAATVSITVEPSNDAPRATDDEYSQHAGTILSVPASSGLLANDSELDGEGITPQLVDDPAHGTLSLNTDGSFTYSPHMTPLPLVGSDTFTYRLSDGTGVGNTATVTIVLPNAPPVATADVYTVRTNGVLTVTDASGLLSNDSDPDQDPLGLYVVVPPTNGSVSLTSGGGFTYNAPTGFTGTVQFQYLVSDSLQASSIATATINVTDLYTEAYDNSYNVIHDRTLMVPVSQGVLSNDWDADGGSLSASLVSTTSHGQVTLASDGSFVYQPVAGYVGADSFTYTASDGEHTDTATVTIQVTNQTPVLSNDSYQTIHDRVLTVSAANRLTSNDSDLDTDSLIVSLEASPAHGTLQLNSDGTFSFTPQAGYVGNDVFKYRASDGATSVTATVTLTIQNTPPLPAVDAYETQHDRVLNISSFAGVALNDDDDDGDALTVSLDTNPSSGTLVLRPDGSFDYTPQAGFVGTVSFNYRVQDGAATSSPIQVTIHVTDRAPTAGDLSYSSFHDRPLIVANDIGVLTTAGDEDGEPVTAVLSSSPEHGSLQLQAAGGFTYTPAAGFTGSDKFTYRIYDGVQYSQPATVTLNVQNRTPITFSDEYEVVHDVTLVADAASGVLANDWDPNGDTLSITAGAAPEHGTVTWQSTGAFTYVPDAGFAGTDSFTYRVNDGAMSSDPIRVTVQVRNGTPLSTFDTYSVRHGQTLNISHASGVLANDQDADASDTMAAQIVTNPQHGSVTLNSDGSFTYVPEANFTGTDSFQYKTCDGIACSRETTSFVLVTNQNPVVQSDDYFVSHDRDLVVAANQGVLANDQDGDSQEVLSGETVLLPAHGTLEFNSDGSFTYVPNEGFVGTDSFTYRASDGVSQSGLAVARVVVGNAIPDTLNDTFSVLEDGTLSSTTSVLANDSDGDADDLTVALVRGTEHGTLTFQANGTFSYTPGANFHGSDHFVYSVSDGKTTVTESAIIQVVSLNDVPSASNSSLSVHANRAATGSVLPNISDNDQDTLRAELVSGPSHGTVILNPDGSFSYTPNANYQGSDSFSFRAADSQSASGAATVSLSVGNQAPQPNMLLSYTAYNGATLQVSAATGVVAASRDPDGDPMTANLVSGTSHGTLALSSDGSFDYTPNANYVGTDSFSYTLSDGLATSSAATVNINVTDSPITANPNFYRTLHDTILIVGTKIGVLYNDWHWLGDPITAVLETGTDKGPFYGSVALNSDGTFTYVPVAGFVGDDFFTYHATDGTDDSASVKAHITVTDRPPVGGNDNYSVLHGKTLSIPKQLGVATDDYDDDGEPFSVSLVTGPSHGTLALLPDGSFVYQAGQLPNGRDFVGTDGFTYELFDGAIHTGPYTVTIEVGNHAPVGSANAYSVFHGQPLNVSAADGVSTDDYDFDVDSFVAELFDDVDHGTLTLNANGSFQYQANPVAGKDYVGEDSFSYRLFDGAEYSEPIEVTIDVWNNIPTPNENFYTMHHGQTLNIGAPGVLGNDVEWDGDSLTAELVASPSQGSLTLNSDGSFTYTPGTYQGKNFVGSVDFTYRVFDGAEYTTPVKVTMDVRNHLPTGVNDYFETHHDTPLTGNVLTNLFGKDWDYDQDSIRAVPLQDPQNAQSFSLSSSGVFNFTPATNFVGEVYFLYQVEDDAGISPKSVRVVINVTNDDPFAVEDFYTTSPGQAITIGGQGVLANDFPFDGDTLTVELVDQPENGEVTLQPNGTFVYTPRGSGVTCSTGATSGGGGGSPGGGGSGGSGGQSEVFVGVDTFSYKVTDNIAEDEATVAIHVLNHLVVALDDRFHVLPGNSITNNVRTNAAPVGPDIADRATLNGGALQRTPLPADQVKVTLLEGPEKGELINGGLTDRGDFTYRANHTAQGLDKFTYELSDCLGNKSKATAIIDLNNEPPTANDDTKQVDEDQQLTINVSDLLANDTDPDTPLDPDSFKVVRSTRQGQLSVNQGTLTYTPRANFNGVDSFTYVISDEIGAASIEARVQIDVNPVNDPINANGDLTGVSEDSNVLIDVLRNDSDIDGPIDPATVTLTVTRQPDHGTATVSGSKIQYTPNANWYGEDTFEYKANDGLDSNTASVTVDVYAINDVPVAYPDSATTNEDTPVAISVLNNDVDLDTSVSGPPGMPPPAGIGSVRLVEVVSPPANGIVRAMVSQGSLLYVPNPDFNGSDSFTYRVYDADWGESNTTTVNITVAPIDDNYPTEPQPATYTDDYRPGSCPAPVPPMMYVPPDPSSATITGSGSLSSMCKNVRVEVSSDGAVHVALSNNKATVTALYGTTFSVMVSAPMGGVADGEWSGAASGGLDFSASGNLLNGISITGNLVVRIGYSVLGSLSGKGVHPYPVGRDVTGNITATDMIWYGMIGRSVLGNVSAGTFIYLLTAGYDIAGSVTAGGNIYNLSAGHNIVGSVNSGGFIGLLHDPATGTYYADNHGGAMGIYAGWKLLSPQVHAAASVWSVVGRYIQGTHVSAGYDVVHVNALSDMTGVTVSAGHNVYDVSAPRDVQANVTAGDSVAPLCDTPMWPTLCPPMSLGQYATAYSGGYGVSAGWDFTGNVSAANDVGGVYAGKSIFGNVTASGDDIGTVMADRYINGNVSAGDDINMVRATSADINGTVSAGDKLQTVSAGRDIIGAVSAGGDIGGVSAGRDIRDSVTAGRDIGSVTAGRDMGMGSGGGTVHASRDVGPVTAGRDINAAVDADRDLDNVKAGRDINGDVTAGREMKIVSTGRKLVGSVVASAGSIEEVIAGGDAWMTPVTAEGHITSPRIIARNNIGGPQRIASVKSLAAPRPTTANAGEIKGTHIEAQTGTLKPVIAAAGIDAKLIKAKLDVQGVSAGWVNGGDLGTKIESTTGNVGYVTALESPFEYKLGTLKAEVDSPLKDIGPVWASEDIEKDITAWGKIASAYAGRDLKGNLTTTRYDIGTSAVTMGGGYAEAPWSTTYPSALSRQNPMQTLPGPSESVGIQAGRDILGNIKAGEHIGSIEAGRDIGIGGSVLILAGQFGTVDEERRGNIGSITAGVVAGGNIDVQEIKAHGKIGDITAYGEVSRDIADHDDMPNPGPKPDADQKKATDANSGSPRLRLLDHILEGAPIGSKGDIKGKISAASKIGDITAYRDIDADILAAKMGIVWALRDINKGGSKQIAAATGDLVVGAWGEIGGKIIGNDSVVVRAYKDMKADIFSLGTLSVSSWENIGGIGSRVRLVGVRRVEGWAFEDLATDAFSTANDLELVAWDELETDANALIAIKDYALSIRNSKWVSINDPVVALAWNDISNTTLGSPYVFAQAGRNIDGLTIKAIDTDVIAEGNLSNSSITTFGTSSSADAFIDFFKWLLTNGGTSGNVLVVTLVTASKWVADDILSTIASIPGAAADMLDDVKDALKWAKDELVDLKNKLQAFANKVEDFVNFVINNPNAALDAVKQKLEEAWQALKDFEEKIEHFAQRFVEGMKKLLKDFDKFVEKLKALAEDLADKLVGWGNIKVLENITGSTFDIGGSLGLTSENLVGGKAKAKNASITVWGNSSADVEVIRDLELLAYGNVTGTIESTDGVVKIRSKGNVNGEIEAKWAAGIESWGSVSGTIRSESGPIAVDAFEGSSASIKAHGEVEVTSWKNVTNSIEAEHGYVSIFAKEDISSKITAGGDVSIEAWGSVSNSTITSGTDTTTPKESGETHDVEITSHGSIGATITSLDHIFYAAHGDVTGSATATNGAISAESLGNVNASLTAKQFVHAEAIFDVKGQIKAQDAAGVVDVRAHRDSDVNVTAGKKAIIRADRKAKATVTLNSAGGEIELYGLGDPSPSNMASPLTADLTVPQASNARITVFAAGDAKVNIQGSSSGTPKVVDITAFQGVQGTVVAKQAIEVFGWGTVGQFNGTTQDSNSFIDVTAGTGLNASLRSANELEATSLGPAQGLYHAGTNANAESGNATVYAKGSATMLDVRAKIDSTVGSGGNASGQIQGNRNASVTAIGSFSGTVKADELDALAAGLDASVTGTVTAGRHASALSGANTFGIVQAGLVDNSGDAVARSVGNFMGMATAPHDVKVTAEGSFTGLAKADHDATVFGDAVTGIVTAGNDADVTASGNLTGVVTADHDADVASLGNTIGQFTADQHLTLFSAESTLGIMRATEGNADITSGGPLLGQVRAGTNADVLVVDNMLAVVEADQDAEVAVWKNALGTVDAGRDANVSVQENYLGTVDGGRDAFLLVGDNFTGTVNGVRDASLLIGDSLTGTINAGRNADVSVRGQNTSSIVAGQNATLMAASNSTGSISAGQHATVTDWGNFAGSVSATGGNAVVFVADDLIGSISAGGGADVQTFGNMLGSVTTGGPANVFVRQNALVSANSGGTVDLMAFGNAIATVNSGGHASLFSNGSMIATAQAAGDVSVNALVNLMATVNAGGDGSILAAENLVGSVNAQGQGSAAALGNAMVNVQATGDANVFAGGNLAGSVGSNASNATGFAGGSGTINATAAHDAQVAALGVLFTTISAGGNADATAGVSLFGTMTGLNASAVSLGSAGVIATALLNVDVLTLGNTWVAATAGMDAWVASFGDLTAYVGAGDDVELVWARGNLVGVIAAFDRVEFVKSFGDALLFMNAREIERIEAWGDIDGGITATDRIGVVRSGADVLATLNAPQIDGVIENDPTVFGPWPYLPDVSIQGALANIRRIYRELVLVRSALQAASAGLVELKLAARESVLRSFNPTLGDPRSAEAAIRDLVFKVQLGVARAKDANQQAFDDARLALQAILSDADAEAFMQRSLDFIELRHFRQEAIGFVARMQFHAFVRNSLATLESKAKEIEETAELLRYETGKTLWPEEFHEAARNILWERINTAIDVVQTLLELFGLIPGIGDIVDVVNGIIYLVRGRWLDATFSLVSALSFLYGIGYLGNIAKWGKKGIEAGDAAWSVGRKLLGFSDEAAAALRGVARAADHVDEFCAIGRKLRELGVPRRFLGYLGIGCFVAGTEVLVQPRLGAASATSADEESDLALLWPMLFVGLGAGGYQVLRRRERRRPHADTEEAFALWEHEATEDFNATELADAFSDDCTYGDFTDFGSDRWSRASATQNEELELAISAISEDYR